MPVSLSLSRVCVCASDPSSVSSSPGPGHQGTEQAAQTSASLQVSCPASPARHETRRDETRRRGTMGCDTTRHNVAWHVKGGFD
ncbi:hypothetical protein LY76DRAFT_354022 [Colletotrichum caudatum]|nr:hypothetical protein LY76DRAFT_354022 [Colletotrichum caudatum]